MTTLQGKREIERESLNICADACPAAYTWLFSKGIPFVVRMMLCTTIAILNWTWGAHKTTALVCLGLELNTENHRFSITSLKRTEPKPNCALGVQWWETLISGEAQNPTWRQSLTVCFSIYIGINMRPQFEPRASIGFLMLYCSKNWAQNSHGVISCQRTHTVDDEQRRLELRIVVLWGGEAPMLTTGSAAVLFVCCSFSTYCLGRYCFSVFLFKHGFPQFQTFDSSGPAV